MGPALKNVGDLIVMPMGCGEQNLMGVCSNTVTMRYLRATNRLTNEIKKEIINNMEAGYQRELTFQRSDNSYSSFGEDDFKGSTWLTAFVARSFKQAQPFIFIDKENIKKALNYLIKKQARNGEFKEHGEVYAEEMKDGVPLTSYVLATLLENGVDSFVSFPLLVLHLLHWAILGE